MIANAVAAAIVAAALTSPTKPAQFINGLELLVACSPTETSPQSLFDACLNTIVNRVSALSTRAGHCPKIGSKDELVFWIVGGRQAVVNYWTKVGVGAAAKLSPEETIDAPLKVMGYGPCISSTES